MRVRARAIASGAGPLTPSPVQLRSNRGCAGALESLPRGSPPTQPGIICLSRLTGQRDMRRPTQCPPHGLRAAPVSRTGSHGDQIVIATGRIPEPECDDRLWSRTLCPSRLRKLVGRRWPRRCYLPCGCYAGPAWWRLRGTIHAGLSVQCSHPGTGSVLALRYLAVSVSSMLACRFGPD